MMLCLCGSKLTSSSNCCLDEGVQLLITTDGQLQVAGGDTFHLQVFGGIACQFQDLGKQKKKEKAHHNQ